MSTTVSDGAGGAIVAWVDGRNGNADIFAQRVTASGAVAGGWPGGGLAICSAADFQGNLVAVSDGKGGAIIAWTDHRSGNYDIYAMRVTGAGTFPAGWPANGKPVRIDTNDDSHLVITTDGAAGAILAWDYQFNPGIDIDIQGGRVDSSGTLVWAGGLITPAGKQQYPTIVSDGVGGAILAWEDDAGGSWDIKALRVNAAGGLVWGGPAGVSSAAGNQHTPIAATDGSGGAIFAWDDYRSGTSDIYATRITVAGARGPGWIGDGNVVCNAASDQNSRQIISDGAGGAIIAWHDFRAGNLDVYAQRVGPGGAPAFGWPANGFAICVASADQLNPALVPDGSGGAIIAWLDERFDFGDILAARVTAAGALAPGWTGNGTPISMAAAEQSSPSMAANGSGGAILAWDDYRGGATPNIFAQTVDHFGQLGDARPAIVSIRDFASDQGGKVRMVWNASYLDADPIYAIDAYWIWRQTPAALAQAAVARGGTWLGAGQAPAASGPSDGRRQFRPAGPDAGGYAWEFVVSSPAKASAQYSYLADTPTDSTAGHNPYTVFMVEARNSQGGGFWDSAPDSGYSVDNLAPAAPAPFAGAYASGATHLHWGANAEPDLAVYRLYRGGSAGFVPGPSNFVVEQPDTGFADAGAAGSYYKLAAVDVHGNVSPYALLQPSATTDAGDAPPPVLWLAPPAPNPMRGDGVFRFTLSSPGRASLAVFDIAGRMVRELSRAELLEGEHLVRWDGRDAEGRAVASGLYVVRLRAEGRSLTRRLAVSQ